MQVLKLAEKAGLVKRGHVALDDTKIKANASKHKAMSYEGMKKREAELQAEVDRWLVAAEAAEAEEDKLYGQKRGDEMPDWVAVMIFIPSSTESPISPSNSRSQLLSTRNSWRRRLQTRPYLRP